MVTGLEIFKVFIINIPFPCGYTNAAGHNQKKSVQEGVREIKSVIAAG